MDENPDEIVTVLVSPAMMHLYGGMQSLRRSCWATYDSYCFVIARPSEVLSGTQQASEQIGRGFRGCDWNDYNMFGYGSGFNENDLAESIRNGFRLFGRSILVNAFGVFEGYLKAQRISRPTKQGSRDDYFEDFLEPAGAFIQLLSLTALRNSSHPPSAFQLLVTDVYRLIRHHIVHEPLQPLPTFDMHKLQQVGGERSNDRRLIWHWNKTIKDALGYQSVVPKSEVDEAFQAVMGQAADLQKKSKRAGAPELPIEFFYGCKAIEDLEQTAFEIDGATAQFSKRTEEMPFPRWAVTNTSLIKKSQ